MGSGGVYNRGFPPPPEDRDWFVRENAVAVVRAKDVKIERQRKAITKLHKAVANLRKELRRSRKSNGGES